MLEKAQFLNIQCHEKITVSFDPRITTIIGDSDRGKSALLRGILWLCFNRTSAKEIQRTGSNFAAVKLKIDGHTIVRKKGKENSYKLDGRTFKAVGQQVPEAISNLLNLKPENFQQQFDGPFWFGLSPGQVSKELNAVVDLSLVDHALAEAASSVKKQKSKVEVIKQRVEEAEENRRQLGWTERADVKLRRIERLDEKRTKLAGDSTKLSKMIRTTQAAENRQETCNVKAERLQSVVRTADRARQAAARYETLEQLVAEVKDAETELEELNAEIGQAEREFHERTEGEICPVCGNAM